MKEIGSAFDSALRKAGIKDFHFHDLRHTFATHLLAAGESLGRLQKLLGHSTPAMTDRYAHLTSEAAHGAVAKLSQSFGDTGDTAEATEEDDSVVK